MINLLWKLHRVLFPNSYKLHSFTYYIPAPPMRKSGYRETEFDQNLFQFINQGHDLVDIKPQSNPGVDQSGLWVLVLVRDRRPNQKPPVFSDFDQKESETIEGLYQIHD